MIKTLLAILAGLLISFNVKADLVNGGFEDFQAWGDNFMLDIGFLILD